MDIEDIFVATLLSGELPSKRKVINRCIPVRQCMLLDRTNITRHYMDEYMALNQIEANNLLEVTTMDLLIEFVLIGLGIGSVIKGIYQRRSGHRKTGAVKAGCADS